MLGDQLTVKELLVTELAVTPWGVEGGVWVVTTVRLGAGALRAPEESSARTVKE